MRVKMSSTSLADPHQRMDASERQRAAGQRDVDGAGGRPRRLERRALLVERGLDVGLERVDQLRRTRGAPPARARRASSSAPVTDAGLAAQEFVVRAP